MAEESGGRQVGLGEIAWAFLKLGTIAFGGPAAHIALMEQEFVRRQQWLTEQEFLDRLGAANLIPGPSSTEMAIYIGHNRRRWPGLVVAGCCFIIPAAVIVSAIAAAYVRFGSMPRVGGILYGVKPVVIAVIAQAVWKLARTAVKTNFLALIGVAASIAGFLNVDNLLLIVCSGLAASLPLLLQKFRNPQQLPAPIFNWNAVRALNWKAALGLGSGSFILGATAAAVPFTLSRLFLTFLKIGAVLFGSGYVLLAFLRSDFVLHLHWLTEKQLLDAVAVGQVTPGPVFTTATFIGYLLAGVPGAIVATVAIFLPGFLLVAASGPLIPRIRKSQLAGSLLDGVIMGSLALMSVVTWQLGRAALVDPVTIAIAGGSALLLFAFRVNTVWLIVGAAIVGVIHGV